MTSSDLKQAARYALKDNFITKMLLMIVPLLLSILEGRLGESPTVTIQNNLKAQDVDFISNPDILPNVNWGIVLGIAIPILTIAVLIGFCVTVIITAFKTASMFNYLEIFRGEKTEIDLTPDIMRTFKDDSFWKIALLTIVSQLIMFGLFFIPIIGWIIDIYLALAWSQATYVLYDKIRTDSYKGVMDVLKTSKDLMVGYKAKYFLFNLTFIGWAILSVLFFGLPQIWTMPYTEMSMVAFYEARIQDRL